MAPPPPALVGSVVALAVMVALLGLQLLVAGPSEAVESRTWMLAFIVGAPLGLLAATRRAGSWAGLAVSAIALAVACLVLWRAGVGSVANVVAMMAGVIAAAAPVTMGASRAPGRMGLLAIGLAAATTLLFVPALALQPTVLAGAAAVGVVAWLIATASIAAPRWLRHSGDGVVALTVIGVVITLPSLASLGYLVLHHHSFFLGPANDVLHGRPMLAGAWSQYGVGLIDALALFFTTNAIGYGHMFVLVVAIAVGQYLVVQGTLRSAGLGVRLTAMALAVAILVNIFASWKDYPAFPSTTSLRFGWGYLMVFAAVQSVRPEASRRWRAVPYVLLAIAAVWSIESWIYAGSALFGAEVISACNAEERRWRRLVKSGAIAVAASAAAVAIFSLATLLAAGEVRWGPYLEFVSSYTGKAGFGVLPVIFFSPGPLMGIANLTSAITVILVALSRPSYATPAMLVAIGGYTGFAIGTFTYYLGRSHPNNLIVVVVPWVAIGFLWLHVALQRRAERAAAGASNRGATLVAAALVALAAVMATASWQYVAPKWPNTALAQLLPGGGAESSATHGSFRDAFRALWNNPVMDPRAASGARMLQVAMPDASHSLVLTEPDLTMEVLLQARRANVLPFSYVLQDDLLPSTVGRVTAAAERVPAGTLMLYSDPPPPGTPDPFGGPAAPLPSQVAALAVLRRRFDFVVVQRDQSGLQLVRLAPHQPAARPRGRARSKQAAASRR